MFKVLGQLTTIFDLPDNWDSYGSPPITDAAKATATTIASMLIHEPTVGPVPGGGVQYEWRLGTFFLEVEVMPDGTVQTLYGE